MKAREFVHQALRQQGDEGHLLETAWQLYAVQAKVPPGGVQWIESRRCFFAGALLTFEAIMVTLDPGEEPTDADLARMDRLHKELDRHRDDVMAGLA